MPPSGRGTSVLVHRSAGAARVGVAAGVRNSHVSCGGPYVYRLTADGATVRRCFDFAAREFVAIENQTGRWKTSAGVDLVFDVMSASTSIGRSRGSDSRARRKRCDHCRSRPMRPADCLSVDFVVGSDQRRKRQ